MTINYSRLAQLNNFQYFKAAKQNAVLLYWLIYLPLNKSWSRPVPCNALGFISNDATKILISLCCSRCISTLTINLWAICSKDFLFIINVAELFSFFQTTGVSLKWLTLFLKLQSDLLLRYVYSMYPKKKRQFEKRTRIFRHKERVRKNFVLPVISSIRCRSLSSSWKFSTKSE